MSQAVSAQPSLLQKAQVSLQKDQSRLGYAVFGLLLATSILMLPSFLQHNDWSDVGQSLQNTFSNKYVLMLSGILTISALATYGIYKALREKEKKERPTLYTIREGTPDQQQMTFKQIYSCEKSELVAESVGLILLVSAVISLSASLLFSQGFNDIISGAELLKLPAITLGATSLIFTIIKLKDVYKKNKVIEEINMSSVDKNKGAEARWNEFAEGAYTLQQSQKSLGWERAKLATSIILGVGALATLILTPYIQHHTFSNFGENLLKGLDEAKWAIVGGAAAALVLGTLFGLYMWRKEKENRNEAIKSFNLEAEDFNADDESIVQKKNAQVLEKAKEMSVNKWVLALAITTVVALALTAYATWNHQDWNMDDLSNINLLNVIIGSSVSILIMSIAYSVFKKLEINNIKKAQERVKEIANDSLDFDGYEYGLEINNRETNKKARREAVEAAQAIKAAQAAAPAILAQAIPEGPIPTEELDAIYAFIGGFVPSGPTD